MARRIPPSRFSEACQSAVAPLFEVGVGEWDPGRALAEVRASGGRGPDGLLVLDGVFMRELRAGSVVGSVLLGAGDVIWEPNGGRGELVPRAAHWSALTDVRLAVLDAAFLQCIAPWPQITLALLERAARQSEMLAFQQAIGCQVRVEDRVLLLLLALAERWGVVVKSGIRLDLPLTVAALAELVAAHRQSVSTAVARLGRHGLIERSARGWIVHGQAIDELRRLTAARGGADAPSDADGR